MTLEFNVHVVLFIEGFCLRFANDSDVMMDELMPSKSSNPVLNAMVVPEGTYEVCSRYCFVLLVYTLK